jgi:hypothetical protein
LEERWRLILSVQKKLRQTKICHGTFEYLILRRFIIKLSLAIAGTIGVLFIFFAAFFVLVDMSSSFFDNASNNNNGVLATEKNKSIAKRKLTKANHFF